MSKYTAWHQMVVPVLFIFLFAAHASAQPHLLPRFPDGAVWHQDISDAAPHPNSALMISTLDGLGGFGLGRMQIDFSIHLVDAAPDAPTRELVANPDYFNPDCETAGLMVPVPANAAIEGETDLSCPGGGDCHLLVVQDDLLYEIYRAAPDGDSKITATCLAVWNLSNVYPPEGRGEHFTSADAAGFPMAPLLFNADEIQTQLELDANGNGDLGHAIRFVLPNNRMASDMLLCGVSGRLYVRPASHAGGPSGPADSVPYGARLRLNASFDDSAYSTAAKVFLNTLKRYGMVLADGGNIALTAESDLYTENSWQDVGIEPRTFQNVEVTDFEVLDTGPRIPETYDCVRTLPDGLFADGFE
jgi:serine/threonine-protein kinase